MDEAPDAPQERNAGDPRRHAVRRYKTLVQQVSAFLFERDPIGINFTHNTDEYDAEAAAIVAEVAHGTSRETLAEAVHAIFVDYFDADIAGPPSRYNAIADEVWTLWSGRTRE